MGPLSRLAVALAVLSAAPASAHDGHGRGSHVHVPPRELARLGRGHRRRDLQRLGPRRAAVDEDARRAADFRENELPRMQRESRPLLLSAYAASGRSDLALIDAVGAARKPEELSAPRADMDRYLRDAIARVLASKDHVHERVRAIMSAETYLRLSNQPPPKDFEAAKERDYPLMAEEWLAVAEKAPDADARRGASLAAYDYAAGTNDAALQARVHAGIWTKK